MLAQSTISKYLDWPEKPSSQTWKTFIPNCAEVIAAIDMSVVPMLTFEQQYAFLIVGHRQRQLLWFEAARHPTAESLAWRITEAFPWATAQKYLTGAHDGAYGAKITRQLRAIDIRDRPTSLGAPRQSSHMERLIGAVCRECVDQILIFGASALRRILAP